VPPVRVQRWRSPRPVPASSKPSLVALDHLVRGIETRRIQSSESMPSWHSHGTGRSSRGGTPHAGAPSWWIVHLQTRIGCGSASINLEKVNFWGFFVDVRYRISICYMCA
jgi:hypothetical protein